MNSGFDFYEKMKFRKAAWLIMHKLKPDAGYDVYEAKLNDQDWEVRLEAVKALGELDSAALAIHEQALDSILDQDHDSDVQRAAEEVLAKLRAGK